jgi:hypothetical protein
LIAGSLDESELPGLVAECKGFLDLLSLVGLSVEKLSLACEVADYDHRHRRVDPATGHCYHMDNRPPPAYLNPEALWCDAGCHKGENAKALPEGVMEHELTNCLLTMDEPTRRSDHYAVMKRVRLMDRRLQEVEDRVDKGIGEILQVLRARPLA